MIPYFSFPDILDYSILGTYSSVEEVAQDFAEKGKITADEVRVLVLVSGSGRSITRAGCPSFKQVIRKKGEKILVLVRRTVHSCGKYLPLQVVAIIQNDAVTKETAAEALTFYPNKVAGHGIKNNRMCRKSRTTNCSCQGQGGPTQAATYTFGCSWSPWTKGCKFRLSKKPEPDKYKLEEAMRNDVEPITNVLADIAAIFLSGLAPVAYEEMVKRSETADSCRIGGPNVTRMKPFSGATVNLDFSTHNHHDTNNLKDSATLVSSPKAVCSSGQIYCV